MGGHVLRWDDGSASAANPGLQKGRRERRRGAPATTRTDQVVGDMKALRIIRAAGVGVLLVAASGASAEGDGVAMKSILGAMGIIPRERPPIEYRERAPLVVPPKIELRAPVDAGAVENRVANWPQDPDVQARRRDAAEARRPFREETRSAPEVIMAGRRVGNPAAVHRTTENSRLTPDELRNQDPRSNTRPVLAGVEPDREKLTDPPTGYRKPAANAPMKATMDPVERNPDSPQAFHREMERRR